MATYYIVIYRMGGTANWKWQESIPGSFAQTDGTLRAVRLGGRRAFMATLSEFSKKGLPATYEADEYFQSEADKRHA